MTLPPGLSAMQILKEKHDEMAKMNISLKMDSAINTLTKTMEGFLAPAVAPAPAVALAPAPAPVTIPVQEQTQPPKKTYKKYSKNTSSK